MVTQEHPYLPDILKDVAESVNAITTSYPNEADRFTVGFKHGIMSQVGKDLYLSEQKDVLIWLVMNFEEVRGYDWTIYAEISANVIIATKTDNNYTQDERDELVFKPKLFPVYAEFMKQLDRHQGIMYEPKNGRRHKRVLRPFWGGGDVNGTDTKNLFKEFVDAILIMNLSIKLKEFKNC